MIRFRRRARQGTRRDPRWKLTQEEEETVVGMVLAFDQASIPLKVRQMRDAIQYVHHVKVSATWISEFKQRHKQYLRTRTTKRIETRRLKTTSPTEVLGLAKKGVWLYFFPPNTTAWLQPLDDVSFGLFKMELGRKHEDLCFSSAALFDQDGGLDLQHVIDAESKAFSLKAIRRSWINTGMAHPDDLTRIDGEKIMRRARETFGLPKLKAVNLVDKSAQQAIRVIRSAQSPPSKKAVK